MFFLTLCCDCLSLLPTLQHAIKQSVPIVLTHDLLTMKKRLLATSHHRLLKATTDPRMIFPAGIAAVTQWMVFKFIYII